MKKAIIILLALVMVLSLVACGGGSQQSNGSASSNTPQETAKQTENVITTEVSLGLDKNDIASYLGNWKTDHIVMTFNKGGIGQYQEYNQGKVNSSYDFTYEVKDEIVVITIDSMMGKQISSFELNEDGTTLHIIQNGLPVQDVGGPDFVKEAN